ncbi:MAG: hypothetical protein AAFP04_16390 [Myxococcota bacterium]
MGRCEFLFFRHRDGIARLQELSDGILLARRANDYVLFELMDTELLELDRTELPSIARGAIQLASDTVFGVLEDSQQLGRELVTVPIRQRSFDEPDRIVLPFGEMRAVANLGEAAVFALDSCVAVMRIADQGRFSLTDDVHTLARYPARGAIDNVVVDGDYFYVSDRGLGTSGRNSISRIRRFPVWPLSLERYYETVASNSTVQFRIQRTTMPGPSTCFVEEGECTLIEETADVSVFEWSVPERGSYEVLFRIGTDLQYAQISDIVEVGAVTK